MASSPHGWWWGQNQQILLDDATDISAQKILMMNTRGFDIAENIISNELKFTHANSWWKRLIGGLDRQGLIAGK